MAQALAHTRVEHAVAFGRLAAKGGIGLSHPFNPRRGLT